MMNWKFLLVTIAFSASLLAQTEIKELKGQIILKDKDNKPFEIKADSTKLEIQISPSKEIEKLVLKDQYQIKLSLEGKEVILDAFPYAASDGRVVYGSNKENTNQGLSVRCTITSKIKSDLAKLTYDKKSIGCIKTSGCQAYVLGSDKKFKYTNVTTCTGNKEVEAAKAEFEESIGCILSDNNTEADQKNSVRISFTRPTKIEAEHIKASSASAECK